MKTEEDYQTSTVDGAAAFAQGRAKETDDTPSKWNFYDEDEEEFDDDGYWEDECNCSDPGCPCGGTKRGGL